MEGTPEQQVEKELREAKFRERITEHALLHNVRPQALRHVVRDAETVFELRDETLIARNNATDPSDPLSLLSPRRWLEELRKTDGYLFTSDKETAHSHIDAP